MAQNAHVLRIGIDPPETLHPLMKKLFSNVPKCGMSDIMGKAYRFNQVGIGSVS